MKVLLISAVAVGIIALMDAAELKGRGRAALWQKIQHQGRLIDAGVRRIWGSAPWSGRRPDCVALRRRAVGSAAIDFQITAGQDQFGRGRCSARSWRALSDKISVRL